LTVLGLRNPYKKNQLAKHLLYRAYTSIFLIIFGLSMLIVFKSSNLIGYRISNLIILVDAIMFYVIYGGNFLIYFESFFYRQELDLIMEEFSEINKILLEDYGIKIDDEKFERLLQILNIGLMIILIMYGCFLATFASLFTALPLVFSFLVPYFLTIKFWFICRHLKIRFVTIEKFFLSRADDQILEDHYRMVQTIFLRSSRIIQLSNKFFQFKFFIIIGE
jgi:hypothetical protein